MATVHVVTFLWPYAGPDQALGLLAQFFIWSRELTRISSTASQNPTLKEELLLSLLWSTLAYCLPLKRNTQLIYEPEGDEKLKHLPWQQHRLGEP